MRASTTYRLPGPPSLQTVYRGMPRADQPESPFLFSAFSLYGEKEAYVLQLSLALQGISVDELLQRYEIFLLVAEHTAMSAYDKAPKPHSETHSAASPDHQIRTRHL